MWITITDDEWLHGAYMCVFIGHWCRYVHNMNNIPEEIKLSIRCTCMKVSTYYYAYYQMYFCILISIHTEVGCARVFLVILNIRKSFQMNHQVDYRYF